MCMIVLFISCYVCSIYIVFSCALGSRSCDAAPSEGEVLSAGGEPHRYNSTLS